MRLRHFISTVASFFKIVLGCVPQNARLSVYINCLADGDAGDGSSQQADSKADNKAHC